MDIVNLEDYKQMARKLLAKHWPFIQQYVANHRIMVSFRSSPDHRAGSAGATILYGSIELYIPLQATDLANGIQIQPMSQWFHRNQLWVRYAPMTNTIEFEVEYLPEFQEYGWVSATPSLVINERMIS